MLDLLVRPHGLRWTARDGLIVIHAPADREEANLLYPWSAAPVVGDAELASKIQETRVNISLDDQLLADVVRMLAQQTGIPLAREALSLEEIDAVSVSGTYRDVPLGIFLGLLVRESGADLQWVNRDGTLVLKRR